MDYASKIRAFEYDVLDQHYKSYLFYRYSEEIVIPYLLQIYGDTERHRDSLVRHGHNETNVSFYLNNMLHGLGHCIRWMVNKKEVGIKDVSGYTYEQIHAMASEFLGWGTGYHMIAQEFVTWSRGIKRAIYDEEKKLISFKNPEGFDYSKIYNSQLLYGSRMDAVFDSYPHVEMEKEFAKWIKEIDFKGPPIAKHIKWQRGRTSISYPLLYLKMKDILFPELDETTDFQGYSLKQLRQFYAVVFLNFHFIRWVEAVLDSHTEYDNLSFGSNPLEFNQEQFEEFVSNMTGLDSETSKAIIADLTFNPSSFHTSVSIQPFIRSSTGTYHILPNLFAQIEPSRMILGALNKGGKKKIYDTLVNTIEKVNLNLIYSQLREVNSSVCFIEKVIKNRGQQIQPDIILIDTLDRIILVADYKHFIGPITASEVDYRMKELEKAIIQVTNYVGFLTRVSRVSHIDTQGFSVVGLIITHKILPIPVPKGNTVPITDMETFIQNAKHLIHQGQNTKEFAQQLQATFMKSPKMEFKDFESEIRVGEWVVKRIQHKITST